MTLDPSLAHQNTPPPSSKTPLPTRDRLQVTVLIAMPDPRRPHPDGTALEGHHSKGKEKNLELDGDEEDMPEMALARSPFVRGPDSMRRHMKKAEGIRAYIRSVLVGY